MRRLLARPEARWGLFGIILVGAVLTWLGCGTPPPPVAPADPDAAPAQASSVLAEIPEAPAR